MSGFFDNDTTSVFAEDISLEMRYDLEILEEYLGGVPLPPPFVSEEGTPAESLQCSTGFEPEAVQETLIESGEHDDVSAPTTFTTSTMAEIYVSQGFIQRAIDIYEEMLRDNPTNDALVQRIGELMDMLAPSVDEPIFATPAVAVMPENETVVSAPAEKEEVVATLERWLSNIKSSRRR